MSWKDALDHSFFLDDSQSTIFLREMFKSNTTDNLNLKIT